MYRTDIQAYIIESATAHFDPYIIYVRCASGSSAKSLIGTSRPFSHPAAAAICRLRTFATSFEHFPSSRYSPIFPILLTSCLLLLLTVLLSAPAIRDATAAAMPAASTVSRDAPHRRRLLLRRLFDVCALLPKHICLIYFRLVPIFYIVRENKREPKRRGRVKKERPTVIGES